jgi:hypothetical protein
MRADPVASAETKKRMMQTLKRFYLDGGMDGEEGSFEKLHRRGYGEEEEEEDDDDDGYDEGGGEASSSARKTCVLSEETLHKLTTGMPLPSFIACLFFVTPKYLHLASEDYLFLFQGR